jgi:hypothetical protein
MLRIRFCMLIIATATAGAGGAAGARAAGAGVPPTEWMRSAGDQSLLERVVSKRCLIAPVTCLPRVRVNPPGGGRNRVRDNRDRRPAVTPPPAARPVSNNPRRPAASPGEGSRRDRRTDSPPDNGGSRRDRRTH